jgi:cyclic pyranopterin phosphate synthase
MQFEYVEEATMEARGGREFGRVAPALSPVDALNAIRSRLIGRHETIRDAIHQRNLYFRVSLLGACNLSCPFCHNEGGPSKGKLDLAFAERAMHIASKLGYRRVQFTGGEPLMHPRVAEFVRSAKTIMPDVGVTTNGIYLASKLDALLEARISRIHISLQAEALSPNPDSDRWVVPGWLNPALEVSRRGAVIVRLNLPVANSDLQKAKQFLTDMSAFGCDLNLFSILPEGSAGSDESATSLEELAEVENVRRVSRGLLGQISVRGYRAPDGLRCGACTNRHRCKEQSHSLRLGVDGVLRPCLATREWDLQTSHNDLPEMIEAATLLALDYVWPSNLMWGRTDEYLATS